MDTAEHSPVSPTVRVSGRTIRSGRCSDHVGSLESRPTHEQICFCQRITPVGHHPDSHARSATAGPSVSRAHRTTGTPPASINVALNTPDFGHGELPKPGHAEPHNHCTIFNHEGLPEIGPLASIIHEIHRGPHLKRGYSPSFIS